MESAGDPLPRIRLGHRKVCGIVTVYQRSVGLVTPADSIVLNCSIFPVLQTIRLLSPILARPELSGRQPNRAHA